MSAYAALRDKRSSEGRFESNSTDSEEGEILSYQPNSSDDEKSEVTSDRANLTPKVSFSGEGPTGSITTDESGLQVSRFVPDDDNLVVFKDHIIIGLKINEYILIHGQCIMTIQRGAILVNKLHYLPANFNNSYEVVASSSQALPVVSSTQVIDRKVVRDHKTAENSHLFSNEYKSVVCLKNYYTGIESIGRYYGPLKSFIHPVMEDPDDMNDYEKLFKTYSFEIVLKPKGLSGFDISKEWKSGIDRLFDGIDSLQPNKIMVVGNKNSGKSTLCKIILNSMIINNDMSICLIDLDPGQSEFSIPSCLSLTTINKPIFGMNLPPRRATIEEERINFFYGFTNPQEDPRKYVEIVKSLVEFYRKHHEPKGTTLIINTPGWIKGYGKEILTQVTSHASPDKLILLAGNTNEEDHFDLLSELTFTNLTIFQGFYQASKYSPSQLRTLTKLLYFHHVTDTTFDFEKHTLLNSPFKVSYDFSNMDLSAFKGIDLVSILNYDANSDFNIEDVALMIESSIVSIHVLDEDVFASIASKINKHNNLPNYLNSSDFESITRDNSYSQVKFLGLAMVHSVNLEEKYFNIYISSDIIREIENVTRGGSRLIFVKGDGEIESAEILMDDLLHDYSKQLKTLRKGRAMAPSAWTPMSYPFTNFDTNNKLNGVWKVRKNVMRRSHRH